ncbi:hypothetical protein RHSIM_Rhsim03G0088000 [Rhododendron simsii]|uniref:CCHC-type domain-containing protein n=1 Tax=Rhododendron simsii TaxID=118357 RepID=A0A834H9F3_RHOSS|nr:hypothetical protein RHSIM_Rhsim03G0088000 [Rhododendron simsii]
MYAGILNLSSLVRTNINNRSWWKGIRVVLADSGYKPFADRRALQDSTGVMHGQELDGIVISVNKAQPKMDGDDPDYGYGRGHTPSGRDTYRAGDKPVGQSECSKCGRLGHFARECPSAGCGGRFSSHSRFGGGDRFGPDCFDDRFDGGCYGDKEHLGHREVRYETRDRYNNDRFPTGGDRFADQEPQARCGRDMVVGRDGGPRLRNCQLCSSLSVGSICCAVRFLQLPMLSIFRECCPKCFIGESKYCAASVDWSKFIGRRRKDDEFYGTVMLMFLFNLGCLLLV